MAQLVARLVRIEEVRSSNLLGSTTAVWVTPLGVPERRKKKLGRRKSPTELLFFQATGARDSRTIGVMPGLIPASGPATAS